VEKTLMIQIHNLQFGYRPDHLVLNIPGFEVSSGKKIFLFGPSGSGKSTLLEILAGVQSPLAGKLFVDGVDLNQLSPVQKDAFRAQHIGYIFQSFNLISYLTVTENIILPTVFYKSEMNIADRVHELCQTLGIEELKSRKATELSVGQQQRVAAARALLLKPKLILADEPTSALDFDHREKFLKVIFELCMKSQSTLVFVSHDRTISHLFDRQIHLGEINQLNQTAVKS